MTDLKALIARQREKIENPPQDSVDVVLGGEKVKVTLSKLRPDEWQDLSAAHPPRVGIKADENLGYDQDHLPKAYPAEHIRVAGEEVDAEEWASMWAVLDPVHRSNVGTLIWGLNIFTTITELRELGKAQAGRP